MFAIRPPFASRIPVSFSLTPATRGPFLTPATNGPSLSLPVRCFSSASICTPARHRNHSASTCVRTPICLSKHLYSTTSSSSPAAPPSVPSTLSDTIRKSYIDSYISTPQAYEVRGAPRKHNKHRTAGHNTYDRRSAHLRKTKQQKNTHPSSQYNPFSDPHTLMTLSSFPEPGSAIDPRGYAVPSEASGGVPEASSEYLAQAALLPRTRDRPRRILVVLDLNGTLLWRPSRRNPTSFVERPHTRQFLDYLVKNFIVAVWSSAQPDNVNNMVNHLFTKKERHQLAAVWGRDKFGLCNKDYSSRVQVYKRLTRLWADQNVQARNPSTHPWDQTNTVLVDDSSEKARSEPFNLIRIPEFAGQKETTHILPQVHDYLNILAGQEDISAYINKTPFEHNLNFTL